MKPIEALSILEQATGQAPLNRAAHQQVLEALKVIQEEITPKDTTKKK